MATIDRYLYPERESLLVQGLKRVAFAAQQRDSHTFVSQEQIQRARQSLLAFTTLTYPQYQVSWHHRLLAKKLEQVYRGEITRLMVNMPPRHGKSELVSRRLPAWVLGNNANEMVIGCSYAADLASSINREVQRIIATPEYRLVFPNTKLNEKSAVNPADGTWLKNSRIFEIVGKKGYYISAGVGGPITGKGFTLGIVDDPVKNREEANSKTYRDKTWDWWTSTFLSRGEGKMSPTGEDRIVVTLTRWHEDDLGGRILRQAERDGREWEVLSFPAILDCDPCMDDPREYGQALWPEKYSIEKLHQIKLDVGSRDWEALYQQRPSPLEGGMFKREWWKFYHPHELPLCDEIIMSWDMAFKDAATSSFVVGQVWGAKGSRRYLLDQYRAQADFLTTLRAFKQMCMKWPQATAKLVEDKANGPAIISVLTDKIPGIIPIAPKGDKELRALAIVPLVEAGNVYLPAHLPFSQDLIEECAAFPTSVHDDQVDAMSQGLNHMHRTSIQHFEDLVSF